MAYCVVTVGLLLIFVVDMINSTFLDLIYSTEWVLSVQSGGVCVCMF